MDKLNLLRIVFLLAGTTLVVVEAAQSRRQGRLRNAAHLALGVVAAVNIFFIIFLWFNHVNFPLNLDLMEGTVLQHFRRAAEFKAIYPKPTPDYVPLAYNSFYYVFAVPFSWLFGANLFTLRLVAILGMFGSGLILYLVVREKTGSVWWGLIAAGLFAAAYRVMDAYLDTAHSDSWLLCTALLGSYIIDRNRSRTWNLVGVVILVAAFWFKQHGAIFAIGGVLFLSWREGLRRSWPYWLAVTVLGPILYIFGGPWLFGSYYHYFTWEVPSHWSELSLGTFRRYIAFTVKSYPILALSGGLLTIWIGLRNRKSFDIWHIQLISAALTGFVGTLDIGSSNNVYIPMGAWFVLVGTLGLHSLITRLTVARRYKVHLMALVVTLALFMYNPLEVITSQRAWESYADMVGMLNNLDGPVYAPWLGQLQSGYAFSPTAHWVALEDMIRGPGRDTSNHPNTRRLLEPALYPDGSAFILTNYPLNVYPWIAFLEDSYVLEVDFGDRFKPLRVLPARWDHAWPRYLYRYAPAEADSQHLEQK
jgi:hypothetical protein